MAKEENEGVRVEVEATDDGWVVAKMFKGNTFEGELEIARIRQSLVSTEEQRQKFLELLNTGMVLSLKEQGHDDINVRVYRGTRSSSGDH